MPLKDQFLIVSFQQSKVCTQPNKISMNKRKLYLVKMMVNLKGKELSKSSLMEQVLFFQMSKIKDFQDMPLKKTILTNLKLSL